MQSSVSPHLKAWVNPSWECKQVGTFILYAFANVEVTPILPEPLDEPGSLAWL